MGRAIYWTVIAALGAGFAVAFALICVPPLLENPDVIGALRAGFVNPYSTGYSLDTLACAGILAAWIIHERITLKVRHGWTAIVVSLVPGVATGFALYLFLRARPRATSGA